MRANLVAVPDSGLHDLPPRWDGLAVVWYGWEALTYHLCPPVRECCEACGSMAGPVVNFGLVGDDPEMSPADVEHDDQVVLLAYQSGHRRQRRSWLRLTAFRCPDCGADSILDGNGVLWRLDLSDYGDAGSSC